MRRGTPQHRAPGGIARAPADPVGAARVLARVLPFCPAEPARPADIAAPGGRGLTDRPCPSLSVTHPAPHRAVAEAPGRTEEPERRRCLHGAANPEAGACDAGAPGRRDRGVCHGELGLHAAVLSGGTGHGGAGVELL
jgi:hypothetical protein